MGRVVGAQPSGAQPSEAQPSGAQPVMAQPVMAQPVMAQPVMAQPVMAQPVMAQPAVARSVVALPSGKAVEAAALTSTPPQPGASEEEVRRDAPWRRIARSVSFSGFVVGQSTAHSVPGESVTLSAAELDGTIELGGALQGAIALARSGTQLALAAGFLDLHVGGSRIAPRGRIFAERGMHLQAGRFDIPFGGDWLRFAPTDRGLSSAPAITDQLSDGGLNDLGVRAFSVGARWNASTWMVRGALGGRAVGARVALTPFSNPFVLRAPASERPLEIGLSTHLDSRDGRIVDQRAAVDVDVRHGDFDLAAEWQDRRVVQEVQGLTTGSANGWHVSAELPMPAYRSVGALLLGRWEAMNGDALGTPGLPEAMALRRAVAGTRVALGSRVLLKCEVGWRLGGGAAANGLPARSWLLDGLLRW